MNKNDYINTAEEESEREPEIEAVPAAESEPESPLSETEDTPAPESETELTPPESEDIPEPEIEPPLPSPETARLNYCAFSDMRPAPTSKYAPLSIFAYVWLLVLTGIPVIGYIFAASIALKSKKAARCRLAVAIVIIRTVIIVTVTIAIIVMRLAFDTTILEFIDSLLHSPI